jgi:hypothetical protein
MKAKLMLSIVAMGFAFALAPHCLAGGPVIVVTPPVVTVSVPAPPPPLAVTVQVVAPDSYYWDGYENVGVVGDQYYYLGPGNVWMVMDADRLHRFHDWEGKNPDWHSHAIHNEKYRTMDHAHDRPQPVPDHHDNPPVHDDHADHDHGPPQ